MQKTAVTTNYLKELNRKVHLKKLHIDTLLTLLDNPASAQPEIDRCLAVIDDFEKKIEWFRNRVQDLEAIRDNADLLLVAEEKSYRHYKKLQTEEFQRKSITRLFKLYKIAIKQLSQLEKDA